MEMLKWLAVGVFGILVIVAVAAVAMPRLEDVGTRMVTSIQTQVDTLINMD